MARINLSELLKTKLDTYSQEDAAAYFGVVKATISKWKNGTANPPVSAIQKLVDEAILDWETAHQNSLNLDAENRPIKLPTSEPPPSNQEEIMFPVASGVDPMQVIGLDKAGMGIVPYSDALFEGGNPDGCHFREWLFAPVSDMQEINAMIDEIRPKLRIDPMAGLKEILRAILDGKWSRRVMMLIPSNRAINAHVMYSFLAQIRKLPWLGFSYKSNTTIQYARNVLAQRFLESEAEWAYWLDDDVATPFGDPGFFIARLKDNKTNAHFAGLQTAERLMASGKTIVGGVYAQREFNKDGESPLCIQPQLHPRHREDAALVEKLHRGPFDELVEVGYVATGCCMIHRSVFVDIQAMFPDLAPLKPGEPWNFFGNDVGKMGEDIHFCRLAAQAGHSSWLDCAVRAAHLGNHAFLP